MNEKHWTNDAELIERFVLQEMNPEERNELEDHLRICEVCKRTVRAEQTLIAGIRRGGREQFKSVLSAKLSSVVVEEKKTPWVQILSAAAVVIILLTLGIYNRWFENRWFESQKEEPRTTIPSQSEKGELARANAQADESERTTSIGQTSQPSPSGELKSPEREDIRRIAASPREKISAPTRESVESYPLAGERATIAVQAQSEALEAAASSTETIWLEGTVLPDESDLSRTVFIRGGRGEALKWKADSAYRASQPEDKRKAERSVEEQATVNVVITQQNSLTLPPVQQRMQQRNRSSKIMARVERGGEKTHLTLYLDSLVDERELSNAVIEQPTRDSLILNFANQRIAYKLPPSVQTPPAQRAK